MEMTLAVRAADPLKLHAFSGGPKLAGKIALITGGAKGMGGTISELFALEGATIVLAARSSGDLQAELDRIREEVPDAQGSIVEADVTDEDSALNMARQTLDQYGRIDILVNTAGEIGPIETPAHEVTAD